MLGPWGCVRGSSEPGAGLHRLKADITDAAAIAALMQGLPAALSGVIHAAQAPLGYVDLGAQSREQFLSEYGVRALGAWNLHQGLSGSPEQNEQMRYFVGITSLNTALGQGSNAAIAAGNLVVDGLVAQRRRCGMPGTTLQFSRVAEVGSNAKRPLRYANAISAIRELPARLCAAFFKELLAPTGPPRELPVLLADVDWPSLQTQIGQHLPVLSKLCSRAEVSHSVQSPVIIAEPLPLLARDLEDIRSSGIPVAVVGGGLGGLASALELQRRGLRFRLLERSSRLGGSWAWLANCTSKVQIERGTYHLGMASGKPSSAKLPNYASRDDLLAHIQAVVTEHDLLEHCCFGAEVCRAQAQGTDYRVQWHHPDGGAEDEDVFGAVGAAWFSA
eukprot:TRINITY_DN29962_c0_g1_i1.p1 TRINITY_DN29962_c0_g1~~TRINITY_DN29962_c0_g1_i1.p1  ORF type:complete len:389 (+),score=62.18 TRINITY_DN29962_c0_g1_i1:1125-2291(+)